MGLDNIPHNYPCRTNGTAIMEARLDADGNAILDDDGTPIMSINCQATQAAGGCQWLNANPPEGGRVTGMFGTSCWYRGKYGNFLLEEVLSLGYDENEGISFYGSNFDGSYKSAGECLVLADAIKSAAEDITWVEDPASVDYFGTGVEAAAIEYKDDVEYAEWWLRWAAEYADGSDCWY